LNCSGNAFRQTIYTFERSHRIEQEPLTPVRFACALGSDALLDESARLMRWFAALEPAPSL
jgi:hypothetical protein